MATMEKQPFGRMKDGHEVCAYTLKNAKGTEARFINYGARLVSLVVRDASGHPVDVVLGYDDIETYEQDDKFLGAIAGRCANRIARARFTLDGREYLLAKNDGNNHLHGGKVGFDKKFWSAEEREGVLVFTYTSPDGEENYPGTLRSSVSYELSEDDELVITYEATTDKDTVCNLTNHSYFNLDGFASGDVLKQKIQIFADHYTWADAESLPDGRILPVEGTPMDLRQPSPIGAHIGDAFEELEFGRGYDHNWCINENPADEKKNGEYRLKKVAYAEAASTGIAMTVYSTLPGVQFYSGNFLDANLPGKDGVRFQYRSGFCLETQYYPNALANPKFAQPILKQGETWKSQTIYRLETK